MKRTRRRGIPRYRLHKRSGQAVVSLGGRDFYLGKHNAPASRDEYDRLIREWLANNRILPADVDQLGFTLNELILAYWEHAEAYHVKNGRKTSELSVIKGALRYVRRLWGREQVADFGPLKLKACRQEMLAQESPRLARSTVNRYVNKIRAMFKWGVENELVPVAVWQALKAVAGLKRGRTPAPEPDPVRTVPWAFVEAVQPHVSRPVWGMIQLQELTGMRPGEVVLMRAVDLNMTGDVWTYIPQEHKTEHHGRAREIYLGPQAQAVVREFLTMDLQASLFSPTFAEAERRADQRRRRKSPVQPSQVDRSRPHPRWQPREHYDTASYRKAVQRGVKKANAALDRENERDGTEQPPVPDWSPNQLRHNALTRARRAGGLETAQAVGGHSHAETTEIYAELERQRAVEFMRKHG